MRIIATAFAAGTGLLQLQPALPGPALTAGLLVAAVVLFTFAASAAVRMSRPAVAQLGLMAAALLLGLGWATVCAERRLDEALSAKLEAQDVVLVGVVSGLPQELERGMRFTFDVEQGPPGVPPLISLAWYRGRDETADESPRVPVRAGERWRFTVRLKRPHGNLNPQGFDYEGWLFERGIRATGYVRPGPGAERVEARVWRPRYVVEMLRESIRDRYRATLPDAPYAGILVALSIGDQQAIDPELWLTFARTGITHLMSISGLHVTMLAGLAYALVNWLWRRSSRLSLRLPAQKAAALGGFAAAFAYCLLSGFAIPAQRTLYMLGVAALAQFAARELSASRVLAFALLLVSVLDPWAVLAPGFWLSFGAVGILFYVVVGRVAEGDWLRAWLRTQWAVTIGMLPALLLLFQQFSLVSPLANAFAIPLVSFVVTPLALLGSLPLLSPLLYLAHWVTAVMMVAIEWLASLPWAVWQQASPAPWSVVLALVGGAWLLLPRGFPARWLGLLCFLPLLGTEPSRPTPGQADVTVLDVGQGLAVHVQTAHHDLLFDTGPRFSAEADSGNRIILPYLRASGVRRLDTLVVSHADKDHEGGAESVLAALPVARLKTSLPFEHALSAQPVVHQLCVDGDRWEWDGVRFEMLHPGPDPLSRKTNDLSCVLRVSAGDRAVLLTSDIESVSEQALLQRHRPDVAAAAMTVPHHGSRTSSTVEFVAAVGARDVVFPVGYLNRFGHPKEDVVSRYRESGARLHRTDADGAVRIRLTPAELTFSHERELRRRYWHSPPAR